MATVIKAGADDAKKYRLGEGRGDKGGFIREVDFEANSRGLDPMSEGIKTSIATPFHRAAGSVDQPRAGRSSEAR